MHKQSRLNDLHPSAHILSADEPADPPQFPEISTRNHDLMESGWCPVAGLHSGSMKRHRDLDKHSCGKTIAPHEQTCAVALNMASQSLPSVLFHALYFNKGHHKNSFTPCVIMVFHFLCHVLLFYTTLNRNINSALLFLLLFYGVTLFSIYTQVLFLSNILHKSV